MRPNSVLHCGMAVVRPPGHHASADRAAGFCLFNNVATGVVCFSRSMLDNVGVDDILGFVD